MALLIRFIKALIARSKAWRYFASSGSFHQSTVGNVVYTTITMLTLTLLLAHHSHQRLPFLRLFLNTNFRQSRPSKKDTRVWQGMTMQLISLEREWNVVITDDVWGEVNAKKKKKKEDGRWGVRKKRKGANSPLFFFLERTTKTRNTCSSSSSSLIIMCVSDIHVCVHIHTYSLCTIAIVWYYGSGMYFSLL